MRRRLPAGYWNLGARFAGQVRAAIAPGGLRYACLVSDAPTNVKAGLCSECRHARAIKSDRGSTFVMCQLSASDPNFPKYPRLPVLSCAGYSPNSNPPPGSQLHKIFLFTIIITMLI
jgi:hypothetical protein